MILHTQPSKKWTTHDFLLLQAYQILQDERCGQCGLPRYICHNDDPRIRVRVEEDSCAIKGAVESRERMNSKNKNYVAPVGTQLQPEPYTSDGSDLVSFREPYYRAEAERREKIRESLLPRS